MLDWRPIMAPSPVAAGGGVSASGALCLSLDHGYIGIIVWDERDSLSETLEK
jgi:hypothetical protein